MQHPKSYQAKALLLAKAAHLLPWFSCLRLLPLFLIEVVDQIDPTLRQRFAGYVLRFPAEPFADLYDRLILLAHWLSPARWFVFLSYGGAAIPATVQRPADAIYRGNVASYRRFRKNVQNRTYLKHSYFRHMPNEMPNIQDMPRHRV